MQDWTVCNREGVGHIVCRALLALRFWPESIRHTRGEAVNDTDDNNTFEEQPDEDIMPLEPGVKIYLTDEDGKNGREG